MTSPSATTLDPHKVEAAAKNHEATRDSLAGELDAARARADGLLAASSSEATKALQQVVDGWANSVKNTLLEHMTAMVGNLRGAITDQTATDQAGMKQILDLPPVTNKFLAG